MRFKRKIKGFLFSSVVVALLCGSSKAIANELQLSQSHENNIESYQSLDNYLVELRQFRSLSKLCKSGLKILECKNAIGDWKPEKFERAKLQAPACFDQCMLDSFGFYKNSLNGKDIPAVRTKDFDGSAPSRGFEAIFYPVAVRVFRYEGCAGCALTYQYPTKLEAELGKQVFTLPILARGGYYLPSTFRSAIINNPSKKFQLRAKTTEGEFIMEISSKTISEYVKMLTLLRYDF